MTTLAPFLRLPDVLKLIGLSRSSVYQLMREEKFPKPKKLSSRAVGWTASDIAAWQAQRESAK